MDNNIEIKTRVVFGDELPSDTVHLATVAGPHPLDCNKLVEWDVFRDKNHVVYSHPGCIKCKCCGQVLKRCSEITRDDFVVDTNGAVLEVVWSITIHAN